MTAADFICACPRAAPKRASSGFSLRVDAAIRGLGPYPDISLAEARGRATEHRKRCHDGIEPLDAKAAERQAQRLAVAKGRPSASAPPSSSKETGRPGAMPNTGSDVRLSDAGRIGRVGYRHRACRAGTPPTKHYFDIAAAAFRSAAVGGESRNVVIAS